MDIEEKDKYIDKDSMQTEEDLEDLQTRNKGAEIIQKSIRKWLRRRNIIKGVEDQAKVDNIINVTRENTKKAEVKEMKMEGKLNLRRIPLSVWQNQFKFTEGFEEFLELGKVCKLFNRIINQNSPWQNFVEYNYPKIREIVLQENTDKDKDEIPWKNVIKDGSNNVNINIVE